MQDISRIQLLLLFAFILVPLINRLLERMRRRVETQSPREPPRQPAPRTIGNPPVEIVASAGNRLPARAKTEMPSPSKPPLPNGALFGSRRDLRLAMVLVAVLGPCRAVDTRDVERRQLPSGLPS
jgi:hypothetical protein